MKPAAILDLETSGLDPLKDSIIEIGIVRFEYSEDLKNLAIVECYGGLDDPGFEVSEETTKITGITNAELKDKKIHWPTVGRLLSDCSIVVAHNASFDRSFVDQRAELSGCVSHWGCSASHIDWRGHGFKTAALNYLAADQGFLNPFAHRAIFDCATTFRVIEPYFKELYNRSFEREFLILAMHSPFETKDLLKARGYRWDAGQRVWSRVIAESGLEEERKFLSTEIYAGNPRHVEQPVASV